MGNWCTIKRNRSFLVNLEGIHAVTLHQLELHDEMQLHRVAVAVTTPIVPHLVKQTMLELYQLGRFGLTSLQIFAIDIDLRGSLLTEFLGRHIKLLNGEFASLGMKQRQKQVAGFDVVVVFVLLALAVIGSIIVLPFEQLNADAATLINLIEFAYQITERHAVVLEFFTRG